MKPVSDWPTAYQQPITGHGWPWQGPRRSDWSAGQSQPIRSRVLLLECSDCLGGTLGREKPIRNRLWNNFFNLRPPFIARLDRERENETFFNPFFVFTAVFYSSSQSDPSKTAEKKTTDSHSRLEIALQNETRTENDFSSFLFFFCWPSPFRASRHSNQ